ncbi:MAG: bacteriorhodopsin-like [Anaerolineae bacterium]
MPQLSVGEYSLVYNMFSFTFAAMLASFVYFVLIRGQVAPEYRNALTMSSLVVVVAGYHYFRIFQSWEAAYVLENGVYVASGKPFNDAYRYIDWLLTVPLLVAELVAVMKLDAKRTFSLSVRLAGAAALMVILGYPGEIAADTGTRALWGAISTVPFVYILFVLFTELGGAMKNQPDQARILIRNIRYLLLATWGFYPIVYLFPILGIGGAGTAGIAAGTLVLVQVGYCIADVAAKCGYGVMIYWIARAKTEADGWSPAQAALSPASGD